MGNTGSIESVKSEELNSILDPVRPNSRSSDTYVGGLSQSSDVLIDPQGQLYSTQFCAMKQKKALERRGRLFLFRFFTIILTRILIGLALLWQY
jgi:hypothetical protein